MNAKPAARRAGLLSRFAADKTGVAFTAAQLATIKTRTLLVYDEHAQAFSEKAMKFRAVK